MLQFTFIFLGIVALVMTVITIRATDDQLAILAGLMGAFAWLLWAYSGLNVTVYDGSGAEFVTSYPSLAAFGVLMAIPNLFVALTGPLRLAKDPDALTQEVR